MVLFFCFSSATILLISSSVFCLGFCFLKNILSSSEWTLDVPSLLTATLPAKFAISAAFSRPIPVARHSPSVAATVSPAPLTSKTSLAFVPICNVLPFNNERVMPFPPLVIMTFDPSILDIFCAFFSTSESVLPAIPVTWAAS